jgi:hypothetical protein
MYDMDILGKEKNVDLSYNYKMSSLQQSINHYEATMFSLPYYDGE